MKTLMRSVIALCLSAGITSAYAHDTHAHGSYTPAGNGNNGMYSAKYNPWRRQPAKTWNQPGYAVTNTPEVQMLSSPQRTASYPVHPLYLRQGEYQNYLQQYGVYYSPYHSGLPWWSDPVAVPYGPWVSGYGGPNGTW